MNENNPEFGTRFLPGVDLSLWLRIVLTVILVAVVGLIAF
jgi:hypothetical protein